MSKRRHGARRMPRRRLPTQRRGAAGCNPRSCSVQGAGVVETHGREETNGLLAGIGQLPRTQIAYGGTTLTELDLDALLARRPQLALIDELAHTNAPGSRHPKRHLDVEELLAAGID